MSEIITLQNAHWQVGILPQTGASIAFGRVRYGGTWVDVMRPTP
ncbi:MAG: aldose epimerase, partial [Chloroflexi bacterium]